MGMTSFYQGSLRYDMHGRKRKTNSMKTKKTKPIFKPYVKSKTYAQKQVDEHREKYPSMPITMNYNPSAEGAFDSIEYIMRDVPFGWLLRYLHSTGASFFSPLPSEPMEA